MLPRNLQQDPQMKIMGIKYFTLKQNPTTFGARLMSTGLNNGYRITMSRSYNHRFLSPHKKIGEGIKSFRGQPGTGFAIWEQGRVLISVQSQVKGVQENHLQDLRTSALSDVAEFPQALEEDCIPQIWWCNDTLVSQVPSKPHRRFLGLNHLRHS